MWNSVDKPEIYLDHAAATPVHPAVIDVVSKTLREVYGNAGSFYRAGRRAFDILQSARQTIAETLQVSAGEIIFTSSGTEADNLAVLGLARAYKDRGNHVVISAIAHPAVLAVDEKSQREGFVVTKVLPDEYGVVSVAAIQTACTPETILVSVMYANNEIGTIEPIKEIVASLKHVRDDDFTPLFHTDACQTLGLIPTLPRELGVDAMTLNSAKVYGPKGVGVLFLKKDTRLSPLIVGGHQEHNLRAGTENVPLIAGTAEAFKIAVAEQTTEATRLRKLQSYFMTEMKRALPQAILNGHSTDRLPNNLHYCFPHIEGESLVLLLDQAGIATATGSACSSGDLEPSHVLTAIGRDEEIIHGSLRLTMGRGTTQEDLDYTLAMLTKAVERLESLSINNIRTIKR
jgi:cysteine desulfurase